MGAVIGLFVRSSGRSSRHRGGEPRRSWQVLPLVGAIGFGVVASVALGGWPMGDGGADASDTALFVVVPGLVAAAIGWWIGRGLVEWYEREWSETGEPPLGDGRPG